MCWLPHTITPNSSVFFFCFLSGFPAFTPVWFLFDFLPFLSRDQTFLLQLRDFIVQTECYLLHVCAFCIHYPISHSNDLLLRWLWKCVTSCKNYTLAESILFFFISTYNKNSHCNSCPSFIQSTTLNDCILLINIHCKQINTCPHEKKYSSYVKYSDVPISFSSSFWSLTLI